MQGRKGLRIEPLQTISPRSHWLIDGLLGPLAEDCGDRKRVTLVDVGGWARLLAPILRSGRRAIIAEQESTVLAVRDARLNVDAALTEADVC
jgi:hypothetical protein